MHVDENTHDLSPLPNRDAPTPPADEAAHQPAPAAGPVTEPLPLEPAAAPEASFTPTPEPTAAPVEAPKSAAKPSEIPAAPSAMRPLVKSNRVEWPLAVAGCAAALYAAGCLAGQSGLLQRVIMVKSAAQQAAEASFLERTVVMLQGFVLILVGAGCLTAGAYFLHLLERRPLGDLRVLGARMLAIVALSLLIKMVAIPEVVGWSKPFFDALAPLAVMWLLMIPTFRLSMRESGIVVGAAMLTMIVVKFGSAIMTFAL